MMTKQRGLGRGLDALFEDEEGSSVSSQNQASTPSTGRKTLGIGQLIPNPTQPRQHFDPKAISELAESIRIHGLIQPILVRPVPNSAEMFEIIAGERRWRASQKAQLHEVPVIIRDMDDTQVLQIALIENLQRQDLNAMEEAKGYQRLMDEHAFSAENVAEAVGRSRSHVANMVRLLSLPASVQGMVVSGDLSAGHARALIGSDDPSALAQEVVKNGLSVRQTEKLAAQDAGREIQSRGKPSKKEPTFKDPNLLSLEKDVTNALGLKVSVGMRGEHDGSVTIDFKTLDQLDEIVLRLCKIPKVLD